MSITSTTPHAMVTAVHVHKSGRSRTVEISCPYCGETHTHGWPFTSEAPGHRVEHCVDRAPASCGYVIDAPVGYAGEDHWNVDRVEEDRIVGAINGSDDALANIDTDWVAEQIASQVADDTPAIDTNDIAWRVAEGMLAIHRDNLEIAARDAIVDWLREHEGKHHIANVRRAMPLNLKAAADELLRDDHPIVWKYRDYYVWMD